MTTLINGIELGNLNEFTAQAGKLFKREWFTFTMDKDGNTPPREEWIEHNEILAVISLADYNKLKRLDPEIQTWKASAFEYLEHLKIAVDALFDIERETGTPYSRIARTALDKIGVIRGDAP